MSKARDLANASTALNAVSPTELGYLDGVTSAVQTQIDSKEPTLPSQSGNSGKYLTTDGTNKSWGTVTIPPAIPSMYTAKIPSGSAGGTYTFTNTFGAGTWVMTQNQAGTTTLNGTSITTANTVKNVPLATSVSSATVDISQVASWANNTGTINSTTNSQILSVANNTMFATNSVVSRSTDGTTWSNTSLTDPTSNVIYYNGVYVVGAYQSSWGYIYTSTDGINWTARVTNFSGNPGYPPYAGAINTGVTNKYVMAGNGGYFYYSSNGTTWTLGGQMNGMSTNRIASIASNNNLYVAVGGSGKIAVSNTGNTWSGATSGTGNNFNSVAYGNSLWIAVGDGGIIYTSTDTTTWTARTSGTTGTLTSVMYISGATYPWVISTQNGPVLLSTDGTTWISQPTGATSNIYGLTYFNGKYRISGDEGRYFTSPTLGGTIASDYYATFIGPSTTTTLS